MRRNIGRKTVKKKVEAVLEQPRVIIVSGPPGFNPATALFVEAVQVLPDDVLVTIERPGNVQVDVVEDV
jgi:hypothetical protein